MLRPLLPRSAPRVQVLAVKRAEAEAESKHLAGIGTARMRQARRRDQAPRALSGTTGRALSGTTGRALSGTTGRALSGTTGRALSGTRPRRTLGAGVWHPLTRSARSRESALGQAITDGFQGSIHSMQESCGLAPREVVHMMLVPQARPPPPLFVSVNGRRCVCEHVCLCMCGRARARACVPVCQTVTSARVPCTPSSRLYTTPPLPPPPRTQ